MEIIYEKNENDDDVIRSPDHESYSSSSSSSIGEDSDRDRDGDGDDDDDDVESNINGSFDQAIQALEQALPFRRGISNYYNGKSKSFTSLGDVWPLTKSSSIQDIAKPENVYSRKRRNLAAYKLSKTKAKKISKKTKPANKQQFTPTFTRHSTTTNVPLPHKSFSMVNLHRCSAAKIGNC